MPSSKTCLIVVALLCFSYLVAGQEAVAQEAVAQGQVPEAQAEQEYGQPEAETGEAGQQIVQETGSELMENDNIGVPQDEGTADPNGVYEPEEGQQEEGQEEGQQEGGEEYDQEYGTEEQDEKKNEPTQQGYDEPDDFQGNQWNNEYGQQDEQEWETQGEETPDELAAEAGVNGADGTGGGAVFTWLVALLALGGAGGFVLHRKGMLPEGLISQVSTGWGKLGLGGTSSGSETNMYGKLSTTQDADDDIEALYGDVDVAVDRNGYQDVL